MGRDEATAGQAALVDRRARALGPAYRLFYRDPLQVVRGEGVYLQGADGRMYLDCYNNVASVGHCHPHVVAAIARQAAELNTHTRYLSEGVVAYAERLLATLPWAEGHVMFTCSGSEANDLALRVARGATGAEGVIVTACAYHGTTEATAECSPSLGPTAVGRRVRTVPVARGVTADGLAAGVGAAVADLARAGMRPAALLVDTILSSDGIFSAPGLLAPMVRTARAAGALVIADEVQAGFGRTGAGLWGFARHGIAPDIVTMGKPMGAGHPIAAMAVQAQALRPFADRVRYFNTFGGNPVAVAAGQAVLEVIEGEGLIGNAARVGAILRDGLASLAASDERLVEVRGAGLFIGVDLGEARGDLAAAVVNGLRDRGVLVSTCGATGHVLKIRPPLPFGPDHADRLLTELDRVLKAID